MERARKEAFGLIATDPTLSEEHHQRLKENLLSKFKGRLGLINVA